MFSITSLLLALMAAGWLSQRELRIIGLDNNTVNYLLKKAIEDHENPAAITLSISNYFNHEC